MKEYIMTYWIINILSVFAVCTLLVGALIPHIVRISFLKKLFDLPDDRKVHNDMVPRFGGVAFVPVILLSIFVSIGINLLSGHSEIMADMECEACSMSFLFCAMIVMCFVGIADDLTDVRYRTKFITQILCAVLLIAGGVFIGDLHGVLFVRHMPDFVSYLFTILVVVFVINSINLIDGIDGLASGLCIVAALYYGCAFFALQRFVYALLSFAVLGVLLPFFYYNVFGKPQRTNKIFMGDTGTLTIGLLIGFLSIKLSICADGTDTAADSLALAFAPLLVPCLDVVRVYIHRLRNGKNPFMPDKNHIHHKLLAIGMTQRAAMVVIVAASIVLTLVNVLLSPYVNINLLLFGDIILWSVVNVWLTRRVRSLARKSEGNAR